MHIAHRSAFELGKRFLLLVPKNPTFDFKQITSKRPCHETNEKLMTRAVDPDPGGTTFSNKNRKYARKLVITAILFKLLK